MQPTIYLINMTNYESVRGAGAGQTVFQCFQRRQDTQQNCSFNATNLFMDQLHREYIFKR